MKKEPLYMQLDAAIQARLDRRKFLSRAGIVGLGAAATGLMIGGASPARADEAESSAEAAEESAQSMDTVKEIFTAALIAEDLATTFYYNVLIGEVIQDKNLAGGGGTATHVTSQGNEGNVEYIRAALTEEIEHANLFRALLGIKDSAQDPVQTFYFPSHTFKSLYAFTGLLDALENAFIGAYLNAIQEFANKAARGKADKGGSMYTAEQLEYFAKVSASIMGVECEHRVLGRVISNFNPANNRVYEETDGLNAVYNGPKSAVAALTPFLMPSNGEAYSLQTALNNQSSVSLPVKSILPAY